MIFTGCGTALITPFTGGDVDYKAFATLVDRQVKAGIDFLVPLGTTGETPCLEDDERIKVLETAKEHSNGLPILVGGGTNSLAHTVRSMKMLDPHGVDGFLIVVPYYNKPTQEGQYQYFKAVAESTDKPIVLYNVPGRTGVNMTADTTLRLAREFENVVAIKEASGNISQMDEIIKNKPQDFDVISGDDGITFPLITLGAVGVISVIGNALPYEFSRMVRLALRGEYPQALEIHHRFTELFKLLFVDGNPAGVKALLSEMGLIKNELRLPLVPARLGTEKRISELATELGIRI